MMKNINNRSDPTTIILKDLSHSPEEERFYCLGNVSGGILTVRLTSCIDFRHFNGFRYLEALFKIKERGIHFFII